MKRTFLSLFALCLSIAAGAQAIPVNPKFGAVSEAEVDLKVYEPDTSAVAVMLYRSYDLDLVFNADLDIVQEVTVHERIKVLKEEGVKYADYSFVYLYSNEVKEKYSGIKVETYNREGGKIVKTKMSKKYEFDEKYSDDARRHSFTAENVRVGSVIEVTYQFTTPRFFAIDNIYLQLAIPVNETDVVVGHSEYFKVNRSQRGYIMPQYKSDSRLRQTATGDGILSYQVYTDNFHAVDLPAMYSESFSYCPSQYRSQVLYDFSGVSIPGAVYKNYSSTWSDVDHAIAESDILESVKERFRDTKELKAILQDVEGDDQKILAVRKYVTDRVKWDEKSRLIPKGDREIFKQASGSDADINSLTASALNSVGFTAEPVMIHRRSEGVLLDFHVSINAFDTFILKVTSPDGSKSWFLDAAREYGYLNVLSPDFLVSQARLIHLDGNGEWVDLTGISKQNRINQMVTTHISPEGYLEGKSSISAVAQASYSVKAHYDDYDTEDAYLEDLESDEGIQVREFEFNKEYGPSTTITYTFEKDLDDSGDRLYIQPFLEPFHSASAFQKDDRKIPVDFPYPEILSYTFVLTIPDGYAIEELPENASLVCPPVNGRLQFQSKLVGNQLSISYRFTLEATQVLPDSYQDLRLFWEKAAGIEKSTIVLKKQ